MPIAVVDVPPRRSSRRTKRHWAASGVVVVLALLACDNLRRILWDGTYAQQRLTDEEARYVTQDPGSSLERRRTAQSAVFRRTELNLAVFEATLRHEEGYLQSDAGIWVEKLQPRVDALVQLASQKKKE